jgi:hypothetical protein
MSQSKPNKKLQQILLDLGSKDDKKIAKAIKAMEAHGNSSVVKPLADTLLTDLSDKNRAAIIELFSSLKDTSAAVEIMDIVGDEKYITIRPVMLTTIWNTKVDFSDYIDEFVEIAVKGSLMEALDCLTIIENLEGPFMEENILECQVHLKDYLEDDLPKDEQKAHLLSEIAILIKDMDRSLID